MVGYRAGGFLRLLFFVIVIGGIAAIAYQFGVNAGTSAVVVGGAAGTAVVPVYVGHVGWGFGFGFFGLLIPLFFILLLIAALRPRRSGWYGGPGGWGGHAEHRPGGQGGDAESPWTARQRGIEEMHRRWHEAEALRTSATTPGSAPTGSVPPAGAGGPSDPTGGPA